MKLRILVVAVLTLMVLALPAPVALAQSTAGPEPSPSSVTMTVECVDANQAGFLATGLAPAVDRFAFPFTVYEATSNMVVGSGQFGPGGVESGTAIGVPAVSLANGTYRAVVYARDGVTPLAEVRFTMPGCNAVQPPSPPAPTTPGTTSAQGASGNQLPSTGGPAIVPAAIMLVGGALVGGWLLVRRR